MPMPLKISTHWQLITSSPMEWQKVGICQSPHYEVHSSMRAGEFAARVHSNVSAMIVHYRSVQLPAALA
jgi:hypothetical protein